jgi:hypothetical protein
MDAPVITSGDTFNKDVGDGTLAHCMSDISAR